jgi:hypothetical protein
MPVAFEWDMCSCSPIFLFIANSPLCCVSCSLYFRECPHCFLALGVLRSRA